MWLYKTNKLFHFTVFRKQVISKLFPFEAQSDTDDESEEPSQTSTVHLAERQHKSDVCDEGKEHEREIFKRTTAVPLLCHKHKLQPEPQGQSKSGGFFLPSLIFHIFGWNRSTIYLYLIYLSVIAITFFSTFALLFISNFCFVCLFVCLFLHCSFWATASEAEKSLLCSIHSTFFARFL